MDLMLSVLTTHTQTSKRKRHNKTLEGDVYIYYLDYRDGFTGVYIHMSKIIGLYELNMCSFLFLKHVGYICQCLERKENTKGKNAWHLSLWLLFSLLKSFGIESNIYCSKILLLRFYSTVQKLLMTYHF